MLMWSERSKVSYVDLNEGTVKGPCHRGLPMLSIRYHREALPSAKDNLCLFHQSVKMLRVQKK